MRPMSLEQILLFAVLILVPLLNYLVRLLRTRLAERRRPDGAPEPAETVSRAQATRAPIVRKRAESSDIRLESRLTAPAPPSGRGRPRLRALSRRDARRGFVLMTVLGSCPGVGPPARTEELPTDRGRRAGGEAARQRGQ